MFHFTPVVKNILIANVLVFVLEYFLTFPLPAILGYHYIFSPDFKPYQIITYMFVHGSFFHLFSNMFALIVFGNLLEQVLGGKKFIILYLLSGLGGLLLYGVVNYFQNHEFIYLYNQFIQGPNPLLFQQIISQYSSGLNSVGNEFMYEVYPNNPQDAIHITRAKEIVKQIHSIKMAGVLVGASGAVFGILVAFALLFPNMQLMLLFPPIPIRAKYLILFYVIYEVYSALSRNPNDKVAHLAHIGGLIIGFILIKFWRIPRYN